MGNVYTKIISHVLFPLHERLKGHDTVYLRKKLEKTQWWPLEKIHKLQLRRLRELLAYANTNVYYYQKLFKKINFNPLDLTDLSKLQEIPFLTKDIIRANEIDLKSKIANSLFRFTTGGSSGEPLIFYIGKKRVSHDVAAKWRATRWWDVDIGDKEIVVWGSPIEINAQDQIRLIRDKLFRTKLIPAFEMSDVNIDNYINHIKNFRPKMLFGYPSSLSLIAKHAEIREINMTDIGVKVAFVTSERLYDDQRKIIEKIFNCRVANGYGGRDAGFIAHECSAGSMHITAEDIVVEIIDSNGNVVSPGTPGEIVITHLATEDFPFIRYRTGDIGVLSEEICKCGRGLPLLSEIQGRTTDFIVAQDGKKMHGLALIYILRELRGLQEFKIIQEDLFRTRVLLNTTSDYIKGQDDIIRTKFKKRLGKDVFIEIEHVEKIPSEKSGKFRYVVSYVQ